MTAYVVQSVQNTVSGTVSSLSGTLPGPVRQGNCVVVVASSGATTNNGTVSSVTLAGAADNFTQLYTAGGSASAAYLAWWADPSCAGGGSVVAVNWAGVSPLTAGNNRLSLSALEVGGLFPSPAYLLDTAVQASSGSSVAAWNSGTVQSAGQAELWVGAVSAPTPGGTVAGPGYPWVNLTPNGSGTLSLAGYVAAPQPGTAVFSGTFTTGSAYNAGVVALRGLPPAIPSLPDYNAGANPQQGDINEVATSPLGFFQQRAIFRAAQTTTTTTFTSGTPGGTVAVGYDTVYEDPYQGWSTSAFTWRAPYTGWYQVDAAISAGSAASNTTLTMEVASPGQSSGVGGLVLATTGGIVQGTSYCFLIGGQDSVSVKGFIVGGSNVSTVDSPPSTVEIAWVSAAAA